MSECRSCGAEILWAKTINHKLAPIDAEPSPDGNVHLVRDATRDLGALTLSGAVLEEARAKGLELHLNHFVTCPQAEAWAS